MIPKMSIGVTIITSLGSRRHAISEFVFIVSHLLFARYQARLFNHRVFLHRIALSIVLLVASILFSLEDFSHSLDSSQRWLRVQVESVVLHHQHTVEPK